MVKRGKKERERERERKKERENSSNTNNNTASRERERLEERFFAMSWCAMSSCSLASSSSVNASSSSRRSRRRRIFVERSARRRLDSKKRGVRRGIEAKAYVLRNVGDLNRDHLESGEGGNGLDIPQVLRLTGAKSVVGRVPSSAVNLAVGVATVSSAHAMVDLTPDGKVMVTDLTSTNGTYIDGEELLPGIPQELTEGGEVIFGDEHCARFELVIEA